MIRLDRFLSGCGTGSRKSAAGLIRAGRVKVDGNIISDPGHKVSEHASVTLDGSELKYEKYSYYMLNKPAGCVSAVKDALSDTVISYLKGVNTNGLFPIGRLDKDTEGLLLITNDGELCHALTSPRRHVQKAYYTACDKPLAKDAVKRLASGLDIGDDTPCLPAILTKADPYGEDPAYLLTLTEGRFHQVKRMIYTLGSNVVYLKRLTVGGVKLDESLKPGEFRPLTHDEIAILKSGALSGEKDSRDENGEG
ncbi:MAG: rRNA pseudouridine synthase [Lachnospiraceae bacterium]|nr:rRNA pseudouridine synthase [Lachnospiraceae bacterium]